MSTTEGPIDDGSVPAVEVAAEDTGTEVAVEVGSTVDPEPAKAEPIPEQSETQAPVEVNFVPEFVDVEGLDIKLETPNPVMKEMTDKDRAKFFTNLGILFTTHRELLNFTLANAGVEPTLGGEEAENWKQIVQQAAGTTCFSEDYFERTLQTPGARWAQHIVTDEGSRHGMGRPKMAAIGDGERLTGDAAVRKIAAMTSVGGTVVVPLPHTGIWVTLKSPTLAAHCELDRRIAEAKVTLGRSTRGLAFSNHQVYITDHLVDFVLAHTIDCNVVEWSPEKLKYLIKMQDLPILAWGMAYATYVDGFPISQPCTTDISKCMHVTEKMVYLNRLLRIDNSRLTSKQRKRMSLSAQRCSPEVLTAYEEEWKVPETASVNLTDNIKVTFKIPTLIQHIQVGQRWVTDIIENTERVLGQTVSPRERNEYIQRQAKASSIRQYLHWIDKFIIEEDGAQGIVEGADDVEKICDSLSGDADIVNLLVSSVIKYINDTTVALIGIPNFPCEKCKKWHRTEHGSNSYIIPIDAVTTFFTLQQLKLLSMGVQSDE